MYQLHVKPEKENTVTNEDVKMLGTYQLTSKLPADDIGDDCYKSRVSCFCLEARV